MRLMILLILPLFSLLFLTACQDWVRPTTLPRGYVTYNEVDKTPPGPEVKNAWRRTVEASDQTLIDYND